MLISPLMMPIIGLGFGFATFDLARKTILPVSVNGQALNTARIVILPYGLMRWAGICGGYSNSISRVA